MTDRPKDESDRLRLLQMDFPALQKNPFLNTKVPDKTFSTNVSSIAEVRATRPIKALPPRTKMPIATKVDSGRNIKVLTQPINKSPRFAHRRVNSCISEEEQIDLRSRSNRKSSDSSLKDSQIRSPTLSQVAKRQSSKGMLHSKSSRLSIFSRGSPSRSRGGKSPNKSSKQFNSRIVNGVDTLKGLNNLLDDI